MWKDLIKQMIPFVILLLLLWVVAVILEKTMVDSGHHILAPPLHATPSP